jgi:hypothetical protein
MFLPLNVKKIWQNEGVLLFFALFHKIVAIFIVKT